MSAAAASAGFQSAALAGSAVTSYYSARIQKQALQFQARINDINADLADAVAASELEQGAAQAERVRIGAENMKSAQRVALASNGIDLQRSDTAKNIIQGTEYMAQKDIDTVKANAARAAFGYKTQSMNMRIEGMVQRGAAGSINPFMQGLTTAITGAGTVAQSWQKASGSGAEMSKSTGQGYSGSGTSFKSPLEGSIFGSGGYQSAFGKMGGK